MVFIDVQREHLLSVHRHTAGIFFSRIRIGFYLFVVTFDLKENSDGNV